MKRFAVSVCVLAGLAVSAMATPSVNSAKLNTRLFNDSPGSTLVTVNNYPALVGISDTNLNPSTFANRHNFRFSSDGGATNTLFANGDAFSFSANVTLSGSGNGEGGLQLSPWFSQNVDGAFNLRTTDGEVAVFGGRLPFYSFTGQQGVVYAKGTTVSVGIEYDPRSLNAGDPGRVRYSYNNLTSGWINFDQANPAEDPPYGLWGILNQATAGGYLQAFGSTGTGTINATFENIVYVPAPGAAALMGLGGLLAARRRR